MNEPSPSTSEAVTADDAPEVEPGPSAISVEDVSASYRVRMEARASRLSWRAGLSSLLGAGGAVRLVPALRGVSVEIPKGAVVGVVGRNGAGKSTLLRAMAGIIPPTHGRIVVRGQVSALLSPAFGFDRDLTGRANIELGALAMGFPEARVDELSDSIAEFAQLGEYLDLPMRGYSTGMSTRLGFAVAVHLDPEILLIDEALAGGDSKFKERVALKMAELCGGGRTIVLVSHGLDALRQMATKVLWLHQGEVVDYGEPMEIVGAYKRFCKLQEQEDEALSDD
jgi:ABC-type polysaccharide/polyol phosphate transport system ATPase subunit